MYPGQVKTQILREAHEGPLASHPGYHKMYASLKKSFFRVCKAVPCLPEGQGRKSKVAKDAPASRHPKNEVGVH